MGGCPAAAVAAQEPPDEKNASVLGGLHLCNNWIFVYGEDGDDGTVVMGVLDPNLIYLSRKSLGIVIQEASCRVSPPAGVGRV